MSKTDFGAVVRAANTYATASETIERAQQNKKESRKILDAFISTHVGKWTSDLNKKVKKAIDDMPPGICSDKVGLLGVLKTCCEYGILPTTVNANRLRKIHKTWTTIDGKIIPNGYKNKHKEKAPEPTATAPTATAPTATAPTATAPTATAPTATAPTAKTDDKAPSKPVAAQKTETASVPLHSNVSSSDAPISSQEHFASLWMQLAKNDAFKIEFIDMMAASLEVSRATLTNVMWQSAEQIIKGVK